MLKKKRKTRKGEEEGKEKLQRKYFALARREWPAPLFGILQTDLNVSHDFASDFNYTSRMPAVRSFAGDMAEPLRGFSVLVGGNAMNALVDNEISRQFPSTRKRRRGILTELIPVNNKIASAQHFPIAVRF